MTDANLHEIHISGRYDASRKHLWAALNAYAEFDPDVMTLTEVGVTDHRLRGALAAWAKLHGWQLWHPKGYGKSENAILVREGLKVGRRRARRLSKFILSGARKAPLYATVATVSRPGLSGKFRVAVTHTPAHVTGPKGLRSGHDAMVYRTVLRTLNKIGLRAGKNTRRVFAADWNLDFGLRWVQDLYELAFNGTTLPAWKTSATVGNATHAGGRTIDGVITDAKVVGKPIALPGQPGFDHAAVLTILAWPA